MKLWLYYTRLAMLDFFRLWSGTQHHVIIVAGICLPLLLLLGIKQGHIAELRKELLTSPSGRQIIVWSAKEGELLTASSTAKLQTELEHTQLIIPEAQRLVRLSLEQNSPGTAVNEVPITLYSTSAGDPLLSQLGADVLLPGERAIVLAKSVADQLRVKMGDTLKMLVDRKRDGQQDTASVLVKIKAIITTGSDQQSIGYADLQILNSCEQFVRGFRVDALGWPALNVPVRDRYQGYLVFCEKNNDLSTSDREALAERGLQVSEVTDMEKKALYGTLDRTREEKLKVYLLGTPQSSHDIERRLILAPSEIAEITGADDVVIPWNDPRQIEIAGVTHRLIGLSLAKRNWLREYFAPSGYAFDYDAEGNCMFIPESAISDVPAKVRIPIGQHHLDLISATKARILPGAPMPSIEQQSPQTNMDSWKSILEKLATGLAENIQPENPRDAKEPDQLVNIFMPAPLLAQYDAMLHGHADYDPTLAIFVPRAEEPIYDKARLYADSIDDVPGLVDAMKKRGFAVMSENSRIMEIHQQDNSLQLLVYVVGLGVFIFGLITVFSVLMDSTDRKRGAIGILRVMGISRTGIFYLVILRAIAIGILAAVLSLAFGQLIAWVLSLPVNTESWLTSWKPQLSVIITMADVVVVSLGALICAGVGAIIPAWRASRLDPFEAIVEGRFR